MSVEGGYIVCSDSVVCNSLSLYLFILITYNDLTIYICINVETRHGHRIQRAGRQWLAVVGS